MSLEEEIKSKFRSPGQKVAVNVLYTYNWLVGEMQEVFKPFGVTMQQFNILRILRGQFPNPCAITTLKERMIDKKPDVSRLLDRLVSKNLVDRKQCKDDRRKMDVVISEEGLELLSTMDDQMEKLDRVVSRLSPEEMDTLNRLLDKMRG